MAVIPICAKLMQGQDSSCVKVARRYFQQLVVINTADIDPESIEITTDGEETCNYNVVFELKEGATGYRFTANENASSVFGRYNKSVSEIGLLNYIHEVQMLIVGADEETKCTLSALDKGSYVVALQFSDGTIEIYGMENGLSTGDYTYSVQENGGGSLIVLSSNEDAPENTLPLIWAGDADAFDDLFVTGA